MLHTGEVEAIVEIHAETNLNELIFKRHFTKDNSHLMDFGINFVTRSAHIENAMGRVIFHQDSVIVPDFWSQTAVNILAQKYFRRVGVPDKLAYVPEPGIPLSFNRSEPIPGAFFSGEWDLRQVAHRLVGHWVYTGLKNKYFQTLEQAEIFYDELRYMLFTQMAAPNSPQFFNTGLYWAYGITGNANNDHYACAAHTKGTGLAVVRMENSYEAPQIHACFINRVDDNLVNANGIMALWQKEARIFKYGSGSGCNYSAIRGKNEPLSGGGLSSGLMSFLKIGDSVGGAIKSGGTTRRASRMVILDDVHPDLIEFVQWKPKEEEKARALIEGSKLINEQETDFPIYNSAFEGEAYTTISGQNSNNSVNISDALMEAIAANRDWALLNRTNSVNTSEDAYFKKAEFILDEIATAAWKCGDPGIFFGNNINKWNTCLNDEKITACNPCAEYLWFSDTACNLASLNLLKFYTAKTFDIESFKQAVSLWTTVLDISISMAGYPSPEVARKSLEYRTLGLGYTNLGALLMVMGVPYASERGRGVAADITALMTGQAYVTSAQLAARLGAFPAYARNAVEMTAVLKQHAYKLARHLIAIDGLRAPGLAQEAWKVWESLLTIKNFRNAQVTALAPTGTISLIMDAQTTGVEPDFSLIKYKELAGGGQLQLVNSAVSTALLALNYDARFLSKVAEYIQETGSIKDCLLVAPEDQKIFDCASDISADEHLQMLAAIQPFVSGGISKTINLPNEARIVDIKHIYLKAWALNLKCISVYRDGCKASQPLTKRKNELSPAKERELQLDNKFISKPFDRFSSLLKNEVQFHAEVLTCPTCGHQMAMQIGVCHLCPVCGSTTGCS